MTTTLQVLPRLPVAITPFTHTDCLDVADAGRVFSEGFPMDEPDDFLEPFYRNTGDAIGFIARSENDRRAVGMAVLSFDRELVNEGWIEFLSVATDSRRQGVGKALLNAIEHAAVEANIRSLSLLTSDMGRDLYASANYSPIDVAQRTLQKNL